MWLQHCWRCDIDRRLDWIVTLLQANKLLVCNLIVTLLQANKLLVCNLIVTLLQVNKLLACNFQDCTIYDIFATI